MTLIVQGQWFIQEVAKSTTQSLVLMCADPGGVLGISSDGDDRMESKVKTQKNP